MYFSSDYIFNEMVIKDSQVPEDAQKRIADFFVDLIIKIERGDKEAEKILNMPSDEISEMIQQKSQNIQQEAFENIRSEVSGWFGRDPTQKRYQLLIKDLNKHIWELENDLKNTKSEDTSPYQNMLSELQNAEPELKPKGGVFQKIGYGVGRGVGTALKIGSIASLGASLASFGLPAYMIGGIMGGGLSILKNSQNTKMDAKTKLKKALMGAGLGAVSGYAMSKLHAMMGDGGHHVDTFQHNSDITNPDVDSNSGNVIQHLQSNSDSLSKGVESYLNDNHIPFDKVVNDGEFINIYKNGQLSDSISLFDLKKDVMKSGHFGGKGVSKLANYIHNKMTNQ